MAFGRRRSRATPLRALWAVLAGLAATAAVAQVSPVDLYNQGVAAFEAGLYDVAARNFRDVVRSAPGSGEAVQASFLEPLSIFYGAANGPAAAAADGYGRAAERFAAHQRRFPESPYGNQIWYWIGTARLAAGDADGAVGALQRHIDQPPEPMPPYLVAARETRARALEQLGRGDEARAAYDALLAVAGADTDPDAPARWLERAGMLLLADGRYAAAEERFRRILSDYPASLPAVDVLFFVAEAKYFQGDLAAAAADFRSYLDLFPDAAHRQGALFRLARLLLEQGDLAAAQEAAAALDDATAADRSADSGTAPVAGAVGLLLGDLAAAAGDWGAAAAAYDRGLARARQHDLRQVLNLNLAFAHVENGSAQQAIASFEEAALGPDAGVGEAALFNRAVLLAAEQRVEDAAAALRGFLEQFPDSGHRADVEALLLDVLERAGDQPALLRLLGQIAERRRLTAEEEQRRGIALLETGDEITALETLALSAADLPSAARAESQYRIGAGVCPARRIRPLGAVLPRRPGRGRRGRRVAAPRRVRAGGEPLQQWRVRAGTGVAGRSHGDRARVVAGSRPLRAGGHTVPAGTARGRRVALRAGGGSVRLPRSTRRAHCRGRGRFRVPGENVAGAGPVS